MTAKIIPFDYQGQAIAFNTDGWINATEAASRFGKEPAQWLRLPDTMRYLAALERRYGKITYVKTSRARKDRGGGTWLHPKLAVKFARWLSVDFELWCDEQIDALIHGNGDNWQQLRSDAATGHKGLCDALSLSRQEAGKPTKPYHFMNESKLINAVLFGEFRGRDRASMAADELAMVAMIEQRDTYLVGRGLDYQARKKALTEYAQQLQTKRIERTRKSGEVA